MRNAAGSWPDAYNHRLRLVECARQRGIKPTARLFPTTVPTVRKWLRRFQKHGLRGLIHSPGLRIITRTKPCPDIEQLGSAAQQLFTFGARRLIREFDLPVSHGALERIWRVHGLLRKRRRKYQRKQDLAHIKARVFQQITADTKDLDDIPRYWPQAQRLQLPVIQYTARDVRTGLLFWSFAQPAPPPPVPCLPPASSSISTATASRCATWSGKPTTVVSSLAVTIVGVTTVSRPLGDSQHVRIPPAAHTFQSDVETVHRLDEDEFFDLESFSNRATSSPRRSPISSTSI